MARTKDLESKLHEYLVDTHALEKTVLRQLDGLIARTRDEQLREAFEHHRAETVEQIARLEARVEEHHEEPSDLKDASAMVAAFFKALGETVREDKPVRNAREAFVTEHLEIAAYEILERLALHANDPETALVAQRNRAEEEAMARTIAASWDRVVEQALAEDGLLAQSLRERAIARVQKGGGLRAGQ